MRERTPLGTTSHEATRPRERDTPVRHVRTYKPADARDMDGFRSSHPALVFGRTRSAAAMRCAFLPCVSPSRRASRDRAPPVSSPWPATPKSPPPPPSLRPRPRRRRRPLRRPGRIPAPTPTSRAPPPPRSACTPPRAPPEAFSCPHVHHHLRPRGRPRRIVPTPDATPAPPRTLASGVARASRARVTPPPRAPPSPAPVATWSRRRCTSPAASRTRFASGGEFRRDAARERPPPPRRRRRRTRRHLRGRAERFGVGADVDAGDVRGVRGGVEEVDGRVGGEDAAVGVVVGVGGSEHAQESVRWGSASEHGAPAQTPREDPSRGEGTLVFVGVGEDDERAARREGGFGEVHGQRHARAGRPQLSHVARRPETEGWSSASASLASRVVSQSAARSSSPSSSRVIVAGSTMRTDSGGRLERCVGCAGRRVGGCRGRSTALAELLKSPSRRCFRGRAESSARRSLVPSSPAPSLPRRARAMRRELTTRARARRRWRARRDATARVSPLRTTTSLTRLPRGR